MVNAAHVRVPLPTTISSGMIQFFSVASISAVPQEFFEHFCPHLRCELRDHGPKGAATSVNCCQYSSSDDFQRRSDCAYLLTHVRESRRLHNRRKRSRSPNMNEFGASGSGGGMLTYFSMTPRSCSKERLIFRPPDDKCDAAARFQNAAAFRKRLHLVRKKHHAEPAS